MGKRDNEVFFYGTHSGAELDLYWQYNGRSYGAEFKYMDAPKCTRSMYRAIEDLEPEHLYVIYPGDQQYALSGQIKALPVQKLGNIAFKPPQ